MNGSDTCINNLFEDDVGVMEALKISVPSVFWGIVESIGITLVVLAEVV
jgi:hypothetical protein